MPINPEYLKPGTVWIGITKKAYPSKVTIVQPWIRDDSQLERFENSSFFKTVMDNGKSAGGSISHKELEKRYKPELIDNSDIPPFKRKDFINTSK